MTKSERNETMFLVGQAVQKYGLDVLFYVTKTGEYNV